MKTLLLTVLGLCLSTGLRAQTDEIRDPAPQTLTADQLDELLRPIALYPDPLVSLILPASTVPSDIVLADRFITSGGSPGDLDDQPWDPSVKALTRYPETLKWLDDNLDWTSQVGDAFSNQQADVLQSIQTLRAKAKALGNLVDTPEQRVIQEDEDIRVVPAQPDAIYVPNYDPEVVYQQRVVVERPVYFSVPYSVGSWLNYDCDWRNHRLYRGDWERGWDYHRDHDHHPGSSVFINNNIRNYQVWHVNAQRRRNDIRHHGHNTAGHGPVRIHHPVRNVVAQHQNETIRRAVVPERHGNDKAHGRPSSPPLVRNDPDRIYRPEENHRRDDHGRGHVAVPRSLPPNLGKSSPRSHFEGLNKSPGRPRSEVGKSQSTPPKMRLDPKGMRDSPGPNVRSNPQVKKHAQTPKVRSSPQVRKSSSVPRGHSSPQVRKSSPVPKGHSFSQVRKPSPVPRSRSHAQVKKSAPRPKAQPHVHTPVVKHSSSKKPDPKKKHR